MRVLNALSCLGLSMSEFIFVYGTLRRGTNHLVHETLAHHAQYYGEGLKLDVDKIAGLHGPRPATLLQIR